MSCYAHSHLQQFEICCYEVGEASEVAVVLSSAIIPCLHLVTPSEEWLPIHFKGV